MKIKNRFISAFILFSLFPFLLVIILAFFNYQKFFKTQVETQITSIISIQKERIEQLTSNNLDYLNSVRYRRDIYDYIYQYIYEPDIYEPENSDEIKSSLQVEIETLKKMNDKVRDILLVDNNGNLIASTNSTPSQYNFRDDEIFKKSLNSTIHNQLIKGNDRIFFILSGPIESYGKKIGVIIIEYDAQNLFEIVKSHTGLGSTEDWILAKKVNENEAIIIVPSKYEKNIEEAILRKVVNLNNSSPIGETLRNKNFIYEYTDFRGIKVVSARNYLSGLDWILIAQIDLSEIFTPLKDLAWYLFFFIILIILFSILFGSFVTNILTRPLTNLITFTNEIKKGNFDTKSMARGDDEIGALSKNFNEMSWRLKAYYNSLEDLVKEKTSQLSDKIMQLEKSEVEKNKVLKVLADDKKQLELALAKDEFLSIAAHHLRTPLGLIRWSIELILKDDYSNKLPLDIKDSLKQIYQNSLSLIELVNQLLDITKINQNKLIENPIEFNVSDLIKLEVKKFESMLNDKNISMELDIRNISDIKIKKDLHLFTQVIDNIISNAIKYNKKDGSIKIYSKNEHDSFELIFEDSGIGIPNDEQKNIGSKFYRATNALKQEVEGTGLGLFIVKSYINKWGGNFSINSIEGIGTKISILLKK